MNNTHQQHNIDSANEYPFAPPGEEPLQSTNSSSERRPRPLRGVGFGDIFAQGAKTKPLPTDSMTRSSTVMATERLDTNNVMDSSTLGRLSSSTLQKQIPKKPPPPAPADISGTNGLASDQAPALPPKPSNQFSPFLQQRPLPNPTASQRAVREQARVIYAYKPSNDDELEMEVDDIIDIIDKNIEDAGWWKGELNGKVGVFPDNFVQLIGQQDVLGAQEAHNSSRLGGGSTNSNMSNSSGVISHHQQQASAGSTEGKIKSVFAGTAKGFSKELESNLEKHNNPASFLSLKRNKMQQQMSSSLMADHPISIPASCNTESTSGTPTATPLVPAVSNQRQNGHSISGNLEPSSPGKLNHITANRAKGPNRRPPTSILNKRNQLNEVSNSHKYESSDDSKEDSPAASLPAFKQTATVQTLNNHGPLTSLPTEQKQQHPVVPNIAATPQISSSFAAPNRKESPPPPPPPPPTKTQPPLSNGLGDNGQTITPKTSQRINSTPIGQQTDTKSKLNPTTTPSTPPWMVELRKTNAEKKRDPLPPTTSNLMEDTIASNQIPNVPTTSATIAIATAASAIPPTSTPAILSAPQTAPIATTIASSLKPNATAVGLQANNDVVLKFDDSLKQVSKNVTNEITELRNDIKKLQDDFRSILGLKEAIETMKIELRTCQSATESQRKYIKELVNNLADERKRIAAMQTEIDRNLK